MNNEATDGVQMKKILMSLILVSLFHVSVFAAPQCRNLFKEQKEKATLKTKSDKPEMNSEISEIIDQLALAVNEIRILRDKIDFWRNMTGDAGRKALHDLRLNKKYFIFLFKNAQDTTIAIEQYRNVFIDVELGWYRLNQVAFEIASTGSTKISDHEIAELKKNFAKSYADYTFIRSVLERVASGKMSAKERIELANIENESDQIAVKAALKHSSDNAKFVLKSLGTASFINDNSREYIRRPSLQQIDSFFQNNTDLVILKLKSDLKLQRKYALRMIPITLTQIETIQSLVLRAVPERFRAVVGGFIGLNYNSYVLKRYLQEIETVMNTPNAKPFQRLEVLRILSANKNTDEFLTTFARLTVYTRHWLELKKDAELRKAEGLIYNKFYEQMITAEQKAIKAHSWLTPFYKPSFIDHVRVWIGPAAGAWSSYYFSENGFNISSSVWTSIKSVIPFIN